MLWLTKYYRSICLRSDDLKKVLIVASVVSFIEWFNRDNINYLHDTLNCEVHVACNLDYTEDTDPEKTERYIRELKGRGVVLHNIHFARNPFGKSNIGAYKMLKKIINDNKFDLIHCHTPAASMYTRLAAKKARKNGSVVMYTCHGFHFHKSAPKKNWMIYYPVERFLSRYCDYLITINHEDFKLAQKLHTKNVRYIPGVGVDIKSIQNTVAEKDRIRAEIGIPGEAIEVISVGELIERKNHEIIIRAIARLDNSKLYYVICGKGALKGKLIELSRELGIENRVIFLGFRNDIPALCLAADIGAFPSKIEGLGLAGIEMMAAGLPLVSSNVHGILDYVRDGETGYACPPNDADAFAEAIKKLLDDPEQTEKMREECIRAVLPFDKEHAFKEMHDIYQEVL